MPKASSSAFWGGGSLSSCGDPVASAGDAGEAGFRLRLEGWRACPFALWQFHLIEAT